MKFSWGSRTSRLYIEYAVLVLLALGCAFVWVVVYARTPPGVLTFAVLNVGQGEAIFIESPTGARMLIDAGPDDSILQELPRVMPLFNHQLSAIVETYPDPAHDTGFVDLLKRYSVGAFIESGITTKDAAAASVEREVASQKIPRYIAMRGTVLDLGGGAYLQMLWPRTAVLAKSAVVSDSSMVVRLSYGNFSVLLMSDVSKQIENDLMTADGKNLQSTILGVGKYGSDSATGAQFVADVHPSAASISVGDNVYGFPSPATLQIFSSNHVPVFRTDSHGTIIFKSDGQNFWAE